MNNCIDINYDFRSEIGLKSDPDSSSQTLRKYHKILWSKNLPTGESFKLVDNIPKVYLYHQSSLGTFNLSSDAITHSYKNTKKMAHIINNLPPEITESIYSKGCTVGSYIIFPKNKEKYQQSINQTRGCNHKIADRFDLTLECIRLFYSEIENPLTPVLNQHSDFFNIFVDFKGYVDYFLLQDLVTNDYRAINYHLPHNSFDDKPLPQNIDEYLEYRENTLKFINARGQRMLQSISDSIYFHLPIQNSYR